MPRVCGISLSQAKIQQDRFTARIDLQILRLDVAVYYGHFLRMQVIECVEQLVRPFKNLFDGKRLTGTFEYRSNVVARNIFHHDELPVLFFKMVADAWKSI